MNIHKHPMIGTRRTADEGPPKVNKMQYENEMNTVARYVRQIFGSMKCHIESHRSSPVSFCSSPECEMRLLCPECLIKDTKHSTEHQAYLMTINQYLEQLFVISLDPFVINQHKMQEVTDFYESFWKGLNISYKESFVAFSSKMKQILKDIIDMLTEMTVKYKNELLKKYDESLYEFRNVLDQGYRSMKLSNEGTVTAVVEQLLGYLKRGNDKELSSHMQKIYSRKLEINQGTSNVRLYQKYMEMVKNLRFEDFPPETHKRKNHPKPEIRTPNPNFGTLIDLVNRHNAKQESPASADTTAEQSEEGETMKTEALERRMEKYARQYLIKVKDKPYFTLFDYFEDVYKHQFHEWTWTHERKRVKRQRREKRRQRRRERDRREKNRNRREKEEDDQREIGDGAKNAGGSRNKVLQEVVWVEGDEADLLAQELGKVFVTTGPEDEDEAYLLEVQFKDQA